MTIGSSATAGPLAAKAAIAAAAHISLRMFPPAWIPGHVPDSAAPDLVCPSIHSEKTLRAPLRLWWCLGIRCGEARRRVASSSAVVPGQPLQRLNLRCAIAHLRFARWRERPGMTASRSARRCRRHVALPLHDDLVERAEIGLGRGYQRIGIGLL